MESVFEKLVGMSITAGIVVLAIIILRFVMRKSPKKITCLLWLVVAFRLVCPFSLKSPISLVPDLEPIGEVILVSETEKSDSVVSAENISDVNSSLSVGNNDVSVENVLSIIWLFGVVLMLGYYFFSYFSLKSKTREGIRIEKNVFLVDRIGTAFILGVLSPKIFIPSSFKEDDRDFMLAHERAHIKRLDHLWKPIGYVLLSVYWFNPVIWLAYMLLCRDIELACDERVLAEFGRDARKPYSELLLRSSVPIKQITACPLAFGENSVKERIKNVLTYKKPALWVITASVLVCAIFAVCFITNPIKTEETHQPEQIDEETVYGEEELESFVRGCKITPENNFYEISDVAEGETGTYSDVDAYFAERAQKRGKSVKYYKEDTISEGNEAIWMYYYPDELFSVRYVEFIQYSDGSLDVIIENAPFISITENDGNTRIYDSAEYIMKDGTVEISRVPAGEACN